MTRAELLAQAADADRQADQLFERIGAKSDASPVDCFGARPLVPAGCEQTAQHASDLRRKARWLRAEAAELFPAPALNPGAHSLPVTPPPSTLPSPAAGTSHERKETAADPVEAIARRILNA